MSSNLRIPAEILLDVFRANDPANTEALQLTCHHFYAVILPNVGTLPLRLVCDLLYGSNLKLRLYRATADNESVRVEDEVVASGDPSPKGLQDLYQMFGR
ncbi:hypothetical protein AAVH_42018 [Aphelenchoides avenae]|nr:hypothetical protein AAVH_42018 [Aphelenchus avenae]